MGSSTVSATARNLIVIGLALLLGLVVTLSEAAPAAPVDVAVDWLGPIPVPPVPPPIPAPMPEKKKWTCTGPIEGCTGCDKDNDCSFRGSCGYVEGKGKNEKQARRDAREACQANLDESAPGKWWECKDGTDTGLTCTENAS